VAVEVLEGTWSHRLLSLQQLRDIFLNLWFGILTYAPHIRGCASAAQKSWLCLLLDERLQIASISQRLMRCLHSFSQQRSSRHVFSAGFVGAYEDWSSASSLRVDGPHCRRVHQLLLSLQAIYACSTTIIRLPAPI